MDRLLVEKLKKMTPAEIGTLPVKLYNPLTVVVNLVEYIQELEKELAAAAGKLSLEVDNDSGTQRA